MVVVVDVVGPAVVAEPGGIVAVKPAWAFVVGAAVVVVNAGEQFDPDHEHELALHDDSSK